MDTAPRRLLIKDVEIFDGLSDRTFGGHVLVEGRTIAAVKASPIAETAGTAVIDGGGRVLMPGMSDAHVHLVGMADLLFEPDHNDRQSDMVVRLGEYFTDVEALKMVTSGNAALLRLSGERDPYRQARLGEITVGAWADLLLVNGDPTKDFGVLADPAANLAVIVKDGVIVKNTA
jgi:imidazolonepropionase-like amidohydrolase